MVLPRPAADAGPQRPTEDDTGEMAHPARQATVTDRDEWSLTNRLLCAHIADYALLAGGGLTAIGWRRISVRCWEDGLTSPNCDKSHRVNMTGLGFGFWSCGRQDGYRAGSLIPAILLIAALLTRAGAVAACERTPRNFDTR